MRQIGASVSQIGRTDTFMRQLKLTTMMKVWSVRMKESTSSA